MKQPRINIWIEYFRTLSPRWRCTFIALSLVACLATPSVAAIIDVTTYGAIPNDSGDDSLAIQNAINAAPANSTIYFPRGVYLVSSLTINDRTGLTLTGDGSTLSILKRNGSYPKIIESINSTDLLVTKLGFDANGITSFGGVNFYDAKRITIAKTRFFDSNKQPVGPNDRFAWIFGHGSVPNEDILIIDNLIEDLQFGVDFGLGVRIEGNTVVRPVNTAGIGVFTDNDGTAAQDYTIQNNTIVDPVVSGGGIAVHLDPPDTNYSTMKTFRILNNQIVYTTLLGGNGASAIRLGTGNNSQATTGNIFDDIVIQGNVIYKDPGSSYDFGDINSIIFGNSSVTANFTFDNTAVTGNLIYYNNQSGVPNVDIRQQGINYTESNNLRRSITTDVMPPSVPTALTTTYVSANEVDLAWNPAVDNIGVYRYHIYRNGLSHDYSTDTRYLDKRLRAATTYTYTIAAVDLSGNESNQSYSVTATTSSAKGKQGGKNR